MALTQYLTFFLNDTTTVDGVTVASSAVPTIGQTTCATDPTHARPHMMLILEGVDKSVNLTEASIAIGSLTLRVQDTRRLAGQDTGWFTFLLADSGGKAALIGQRVSVKLVDQFGTTKDIDLLVHDITLEDNHTVYKITTRDMRERERTLSLFYRSEEAVIWPIYDANLNYVNGIGSRDGYGRVNPADGTTKQIIPPSKGVRATFGQSSPLGPARAGYNGDPNIPYGIFSFVNNSAVFQTLRLFNNGGYNMTGAEYAEQLTPYQHMAVDPAKLRQYTTTAGSYTTDEFLDGFVLQWRAWGSTGAWTTLRNFPKWMSPAGTGTPGGATVTQFITNVTSTLDKSNTVTVDKVIFYGIVVTDTVAGNLPSNGQDVEVRLLSGLPPTPKNPIFYEGTFGAFLKKCYDGDYSVNGVKIRYNAAVMANLVTNSPTLRLIKTGPEKEGLAWLQKNWYKVMRMLPLINAAGEIVPTSYDLPDASVSLTTLDETNTESASWVHGSGDIVNGVNFTYKRDYLSPSKEFASIDVHVDRLDVAGAAQVGESIIEFAPETVRDVTFNALASFGKAEIAAEVGYGLAKKASDSLIDRFSLGGQHVDLKAMRTDATVMAMNEGDWAIVSLFWLPDYQSHLRGLYRLMQVVHINDLDPIVRHLELVDAGPFGQPLTTPTALNTSITLGNGSLTLVEANVPASQYIRFEIASVPAGASLPAALDSSWISVDRIVGPGTITIISHLLPPGQTYARVRLEKPGTRPSGWLTAGPFSIITVADPTALVLTPGADATKENVAWTTGNAAYATRIYTRYTDDLANADILQGTVLPGAAQTFLLTNLLQYLSYTVTVKHVLLEGAESAGLVGTFIAGGISALLATPLLPTSYSGVAIGPMSRGVGTFGMGVVAVEFPSYVEFQVALETGFGTGIFGTYVSQALVPSVRNNWTLYEAVVTSDQLTRRMIARHVRTGAGASAWTTPVIVIPWTNTPLPAFTGPPTAGLLHLTFTETETTRIYTWTRNDATKSVWVYDNLIKVGGIDPYDLDSSFPTVVLLTGTDTYTAQRPPLGFQRSLHFVPRDLNGVASGIRHEAIDPAPSALEGAVKAVRAIGVGTADLTLTILGSSSNWPVSYALHEDTPDGSVILSGTVSAPTTILPTDFPGALQGRLLPQREMKRWWLILTDTAGIIVYTSGQADRDPMPAGSVTTGDYRNNPFATTSYDPDTDFIRVTVPGGKIKTYPVVGSGVKTYTVGDLLDDLTVEASLVTDEVRTGYTIDVQGGGVWVNLFTGPLHGVSSKQPVIIPRVALSTNGDTADIYAVIQSPTAEPCTLFYRDSESVAAPEYMLCISAIDPTARYVAYGTEVGPADYFTFSGTQSHKLAAIALVRDQIIRRYICAQGLNSGIRSSWHPIALSLKAQPWLESISATWDAAAGVLNVTAKGGANCVSALWEISSNSSFSSPITATHALADGGAWPQPFSLTGAQRGKVWYARVTPYNQAALGGLSGVAGQDECAIPAAVLFTISPTETSTQGTLTVVIVDDGALVHATSKVSFAITQLGTRSLVGATTSPGSGTAGIYTYTFNLDPKHPTVVEPLIHMADGSTLQPGSETFDLGIVANVVNLDIVHVGTTATITATFDTDTATGGLTATHGPCQYSLDSGASWTDVAVNPTTRLAIFGLTIGVGTQTIWVRGVNAANAPGPYVSGVIGTYGGTTPSTAPGFTSISFGTPDYVGNLLPIGWVSTNVPAGATYSVMVYESNHPTNPAIGNTYEIIPFASGDSYPTIHDIDAAGTVSRLFKVYISMLSGSTVVAVSSTISITLNSNT